MKITIALLALFFCTNVLVSPATAQKKKKSGSSVSARIVRDRPHIYISFERMGEISPLNIGESNHRIWLRFHNNSRWTVELCSSVVPKEYGDAEIDYEIERYDGFGEVPGTRLSDSCGYVSVGSGRSLAFSVPREHLIQSLAIKVRFMYEWERNADGTDNLLEPKHFSYFYSSDIPKQGP